MPTPKRCGIAADAQQKLLEREAADVDKRIKRLVTVIATSEDARPTPW